MRASRVFLAFAVACIVVASVAADDGEVIDGCYYFEGNQVGCLKVNIFTCDNLWDFQLTRAVGDAQLIVDAGMNRFGPDTIYSCFEDMDCTECILFEDIRLADNTMTMDVTYSKQCGGDIVHVSFGTFLAKGAACGSPGYFYVPCTRRGLSDEELADKATANGVEEEILQPEARDAPQIESVLSLRDENIVADAVVASTRERDDHELWFLGTDGCVYLIVPRGYSNEGDYILLTCPVAAMDTCSYDTDLVASAGVLYHFPIFEGEDTSQCVGISTDLDACLYVTNAFYDDNSVFATLHMSLNAFGGEVATLPMGVFFWEFPHCGDSLDDCALIPTFSESGFLDSILLPQSPVHLQSSESFSYFFYSPIFYFTPGSPDAHHHHHSPHSPASPRSADESGHSADQTGIWVGVMVGSVVLFVAVALIAAFVAGLAVIKKREERGENLYNLFLGGDDQEVASVGEPAAPDSDELLTH